jgi:hypothetical protein
VLYFVTHNKKRCECIRLEEGASVTSDHGASIARQSLFAGGKGQTLYLNFDSSNQGRPWSRKRLGNTIMRERRGYCACF